MKWRQNNVLPGSVLEAVSKYVEQGIFLCVEHATVGLVQELADDFSKRSDHRLCRPQYSLCCMFFFLKSFLKCENHS